VDLVDQEWAIVLVLVEVVVAAIGVAMELNWVAIQRNSDIADVSKVTLHAVCVRFPLCT
jgi:hypothetical protein